MIVCMYIIVSTYRTAVAVKHLHFETARTDIIKDENSFSVHNILPLFTNLLSPNDNDNMKIMTTSSLSLCTHTHILSALSLSLSTHT